MSTVISDRLPLEVYERAAAEFADQFTLEDLMESTPHSRQKRIAEDSFLELQRRIPGVRVFNELLVQYRDRDRPVQVVPDEFVILNEFDQIDRSSFVVEYEVQPVFLVIEVLSPNTKMKDNEDSFKKYEKDLQVPYCIRVDPETAELKVDHWKRGRYRPTAVAGGRHQIPELELAVAMQDGIARFWHRGELLRVSVEKSELLLQRDADLAQRDADLAQRVADLAQRDTELAQRDAELAQRDTELAQRDADLAKSDAELRKSRQKVVRLLATAAGRSDILDMLNQADLNQLIAWEEELDDE